jgi:hypothetical protein
MAALFVCTLIFEPAPKSKLEDRQFLNFRAKASISGCRQAGYLPIGMCAQNFDYHNNKIV